MKKIITVWFHSKTSPHLNHTFCWLRYLQFSIQTLVYFQLLTTILPSQRSQLSISYLFNISPAISLCLTFHLFLFFIFLPIFISFPISFPIWPCASLFVSLPRKAYQKMAKPLQIVSFFQTYLCGEEYQ